MVQHVFYSLFITSYLILFFNFGALLILTEQLLLLLLQTDTFFEILTCFFSLVNGSAHQGVTQCTSELCINILSSIHIAKHLTIEYFKESWWNTS